MSDMDHSKPKCSLTVGMEGSPEGVWSIRIFEVPGSSRRSVLVLTVSLAAHQTIGSHAQTPPAILFSWPTMHWCNIFLPMTRACLLIFKIHQPVTLLILHWNHLQVTYQRLPHIIHTQDIPMAVAKIPSRKWPMVPTNKKETSTYSGSNCKCPNVGSLLEEFVFVRDL